LLNLRPFDLGSFPFPIFLWLRPTFLARLRIESWCGSLVLLAIGTRPNEALLQLAGILDGGVALAALSGDWQLSDLDQVIGQQLTPGGQHGRDVSVAQLALHMALQLLDHQLGIG